MKIEPLTDHTIQRLGMAANHASEVMRQFSANVTQVMRALNPLLPRHMRRRANKNAALAAHRRRKWDRRMQSLVHRGIVRVVVTPRHNSTTPTTPKATETR
jgi:hypothetical protein